MNWEPQNEGEVAAAEAEEQEQDRDDAAGFNELQKEAAAAQGDE